MKDSQLISSVSSGVNKYIKANNERFSTSVRRHANPCLSISRRIMKDSQLKMTRILGVVKYIKANNERFSTTITVLSGIP